MQAAQHHVLGAHLVMGGHDEMREKWLCRRARLRVAGQRRHLRDDPVRAEILQQVELVPPRRLGPPVGQVDDRPWTAPSIAACGASTKLRSPCDSQ